MKSKHRSILPMAATSAFLLTAAPVHAAAVLLLSDNFNTGNSTDLNIDLATRQAGTLESTGAVAPAGSTWSKISGSTNAILSNQLNVTNGASVSHVVNNADFEAALTSVDLSAVSGFTLSFKMQYTGTAVAWSSPYLSTHFITDERANSRFGLVAFGSGNIQAYGDTPAGLSSDALATALGSWNVNSQNSYSLVATRTTATTGNYDLFINGIEVLSNHNYTFGAGGANGEVNFEIINVNNGAALYDDFSITTIPEPSAALLGGLGLLALLRRRRN